MILLGEYNELIAARITDYGWFLRDDEQNEVLLPNKFVTDDIQRTDVLRVFVYKDSEDRITATTQHPYIRLNEFACLKVKDVNNTGAFMDWGLDKDLLVPYDEQNDRMHEGQKYVVRLIHDEKSDRLLATARLSKYLVHDFITVKEGEEVEVIVIDESDLGYKAIINDAHLGLIYKNEVFRPIEIGDKMQAWVKNIREDQKIDLSIQKPGYGHVEPSSAKILEALRNRDGFLPLHDKSRPEEIYATLKMSKKTFKKALGNLYKQRFILLEDKGIRLKEK